MAWLRIDDRFRTHPKMQRAGIAGWLAFCGICYCREHLTDGLIPREAVATLAPGLSNPSKHAAKLVEVGLWHEEPDGFRVHDFLEWNPSRVSVMSLRDKERDKKRTQRGHNGDSRARTRDRAGDAGSGSLSGSVDLGSENLEESARETTAIAPVWRSGPRERTGLDVGVDYHRRNCPAWAAAACQGGLCVPKYLWPQWERRNGNTAAWQASLRLFVDGVMASTPPAAGDRAEEFWPRHMEAHFGTTAPSTAKTSRTVSAAQRVIQRQQVAQGVRHE